MTVARNEIDECLLSAALVLMVMVDQVSQRRLGRSGVAPFG
jgi:hypothetical protein